MYTRHYKIVKESSKDQCLGRFLGVIGQNPSVSKFNQYDEWGEPLLVTDELGEIEK